MSSSQTSPSSPILSLPGEIRNQIWRSLVLSPVPLSVGPFCQTNISPRLQQPALAFVNKQVRSEALGIYYSENTWFLGKIGYHAIPNDIKLYDFHLRLTRWRTLLGPTNTRCLAKLSLGIDGRCYAWSDDGGISEDATYEMRVVGEGVLKFERNGKPRCLCRLKEGVEREATRDGAVLLEVVKEYSASYCETVHEGECDGCGKSRLEKFGKSEVTHLPLWEDIVTC